MPIYAYRCEACGHSKDVLQKVSDARLTTCPQCGAQAFQKQVTAAGFQLKGSGWYVTDFKGNGQKPGGDAKSDAKGDAAAKSGAPGASSEAKGDPSKPSKSADAGTPTAEAKSSQASEKPASKTPSTTPVAKPADKAPASSAGSGSTPP
ncbi:MAG: FmdB family zinc ribbon protein [Burkholderiaceae bacterium]